MRRDPKPNAVYFGSFGWFSGEDAGIKPVPDDMPGVQGIYVGGCVSRGVGGLNPKTKCGAAHAHNYPGRYSGWVCFQLPAHYNDKKIRMHELAHINTPGEGHTARWRAEMVRLGQAIRGSKKHGS